MISKYLQYLLPRQSEKEEEEEEVVVVRRKGGGRKEIKLRGRI
jgi:hypothetical protein